MNQLFEVGDQAQWDKSITDTNPAYPHVKAIDDLIHKYGEGPFEVLRVMENRLPHTKDRNPQNLILKVRGENSYHPGYWFVKAPSPP